MRISDNFLTTQLMACMSFITLSWAIAAELEPLGNNLILDGEFQYPTAIAPWRWTTTTAGTLTNQEAQYSTEIVPSDQMNNLLFDLGSKYNNWIIAQSIPSLAAGVYIIKFQKFPLLFRQSKHRFH